MHHVRHHKNHDMTTTPQKKLLWNGYNVKKDELNLYVFSPETCYQQRGSTVVENGGWVTPIKTFPSKAIDSVFFVLRSRKWKKYYSGKHHPRQLHYLPLVRVVVLLPLSLLSFFCIFNNNINGSKSFGLFPPYNIILREKKLYFALGIYKSFTFQHYLKAHHPQLAAEANWLT